MADNQKIFNRTLLKKRRNNAAKSFQEYRFLVDMAAQYIIERIDDMNRSFDHVLELGSYGGACSHLLRHMPNIGTLTQTDLALSMLNQNTADGLAVVCDEEFLPFGEHCFDLIVSPLNLHWVNDLPGTLVQLQRMLKPNGLLIANMFGSGSLQELRQSLLHAESTCRGGASARVAPFVDVKTLGMLLQRAGFDMPITDAETVTLHYESFIQLAKELSCMAQNNMLDDQPMPLTRSMIAAADSYYRQHYATDDGDIRVTCEITTLTALSKL